MDTYHKGQCESCRLERLFINSAGICIVCERAHKQGTEVKNIEPNFKGTTEVDCTKQPPWFIG